MPQMVSELAAILLKLANYADFQLSLALALSLDSSSFLSRPQSSCTSPSGWSYLVPAEPPAGSLLPAPDTRRRPTPCVPRRAASRAACACPPPTPPMCTASARGLLSNPRQCAPSARRTIVSPCASDASPDRVPHLGSWS